METKRRILFIFDSRLSQSYTLHFAYLFPIYVFIRQFHSNTHYQVRLIMEWIFFIVYSYRINTWKCQFDLNTHWNLLFPIEQYRKRCIFEPNEHWKVSISTEIKGYCLYLIQTLICNVIVSFLIGVTIAFCLSILVLFTFHIL